MAQVYFSMKTLPGYFVPTKEKLNTKVSFDNVYIMTFISK